jgi:hypothetical protein
MHSVIETRIFSRSADALLTEDERLTITTAISANPTMGEVMQGTGGARKVRFPGRGKGKSGGYRVVTFYAADDVPVFLLDIYSKGEKINLTKAERNELGNTLGGLADAWRASVKARVTKLAVER